ncbi:uncharacterized protein SETTUDRAFT_169833 [Exserohilum turcica Et28A]|uniref:Uncharacterized protein n=1 Tax=Exserohilum turcicum (strain 28A) TaxID=671987 RepID=R0I6W9_EXST2|nr:uncharacterized protein SETTUDRAFT_168902 [Exserohilum turcica Et28A]XP_008031148.1 uncharacterized protein SETTUDRAFT_169833 [Exserohilum turcica Et28A]EOA81221.1 hypothetical protein SETTUDRAFT_169833 [Exserohilum turcica Et28A]EOA87768.1 hypothetical protein SETTUDRAFT_168902 [Exserohilum turcica Et28A]
MPRARAAQFRRPRRGRARPLWGGEGAVDVSQSALGLIKVFQPASLLLEKLKSYRRAAPPPAPPQQNGTLR